MPYVSEVIGNPYARDAEILRNFDKEISNFVQICPKEMLDKLKNPISLKPIIKEVI